VVGVRLESNESVVTKLVDDSLDGLTADTEPSSDLRDGPMTVAEHAEYLPPRLGLSCHGGNLIAAAAHRACRFEQVGDQ